MLLERVLLLYGHTSYVFLTFGKLEKHLEWARSDNDFDNVLITTCEGRSVNSLWEDFKTALQSGIQQYVPQRSISSKSSLPWITQDIKRTMRKRDSLYDKYKKYRRPADRHAHLEYKHLVIRKLKEAHTRYIEEKLGNTNSAGPSDSNSDPQTATDPQVNSLATKKLYSLLKNSRMDSKYSAPLKQNGQLHTNTTDKANILNQQFQLVFTPKTLLKLSQLSGLCGRWLASSIPNTQ